MIPVGIALGSNVGDSAGNIDKAFEWLKTLSLDGTLIPSGLYLSTPVECAPGTPLFLNAVCEMNVSDQTDPPGFLRKLQQYEILCGRPAIHGINQPRTIDLDIIYFGNKRSNLRELVIPHPRAHTRQFVLEPLAEIRPHLVLPRQTKTVTRLLNELSDRDPLFKKMSSP
ncbi:MAG: 2-amino-4-hydroxy-6-hydroxymethyldihydropteridine diphosphokinase [Verrucomicrobiota bacterium]|nr:2-amino-4-hydroxy-6-hydroxymethyldihydropteridine diphosphokinase [Verrucomicrobiota bacterium]